MNQASQHINEHIDVFISGNDAAFDTVFNQIQNSNKDYYRALLLYIHKILLTSQTNSETGLSALHLHFEGNLEDSVKNLIGEFLIVRAFQLELEKDNCQIINENLRNEIARISNEVNQDLFLPTDITKAKENKIRQERKDLRGKLKFYLALNDKATLFPKTLMNLQAKTHRPLAELFKSKTYAISLPEFSRVNSYILLNTESGINQLDRFENLVDSLDNIILFDCERKGDFLEYRYNLLQEWNADNGTSFKNLLILTFDKDESNINRLKTAIDRIKDRFHIPINSTYIITRDERTHLLNKKTDTLISVDFYGHCNSTFWELFELEAGIRDLYELRSIKMLNIYSLTLDREIKQYILDDIFSPAKQSNFLSSDSRQALLECSAEDIKMIRDALSNVLELVIKSNLAVEVRKFVQNDSTIVLPEDVLKNDFIRNRIIDVLQLSRRNKLLSWDSIDFYSDKPILILAYRDQGKFQYYFYPNILESTFYNTSRVNAVFLSVFFKAHYEWASYNLQRDRCKLLNHALRQERFDLSKLEKKIISLKPSKSDTTDWDLENQYTDSESRTVVKVKFKGIRGSRTFTRSDLFILNYKGQHTYRIERIEDLMGIELPEESLNIQHLDEIQEKINIYEKLNTLDNPEQELEVIRSQFKIDDIKPERLWKILLQKKAGQKGESESYAELDVFLKSKGLKMVSFSHFQHTWTNPESDSITPLSKKVFIALCEYLEIPKTYFIIMQRLKNASKQATRHSTRQMNSLLKDLFNDTCFDADAKAKEILEGRLDHYKRKHPLDEIGINENYLLNNLVTLVELIQPEIKLLEVETIETIEQ
ncbi:MAG: hypothetical protein QM791_10470 [Ferruginibacter sp.]